MTQYIASNGTHSIVIDNDGSLIIEADSKCNRPTAVFCTRKLAQAAIEAVGGWHYSLCPCITESALYIQN